MLEARFVDRDANAAAAAAGAGLEHDRKADFARRGQSMIEVGNFAVAAGNDRHARRLRRRSRRRFVSHHADGFRSRSDKDQAGGGDSFGKARIFGQKSIAGMDRSRAALARGGDDRVDIQVAFRGLRRTDMDRLVGKMHGKTVLVGIAEYGDGAQVELLSRADHPHGDLRRD